MPYINHDARKIVHLKESDGNAFDAIVVDDIITAGELQYAMAVMFKSYLKRKGLNYQNCNDIMGALAGAQMEFYRRVVSPYEDSCIERNGDV